MKKKNLENKTNFKYVVAENSETVAVGKLPEHEVKVNRLLNVSLKDLNLHNDNYYGIEAIQIVGGLFDGYFLQDKNFISKIHGLNNQDGMIEPETETLESAMADAISDSYHHGAQISTEVSDYIHDLRDTKSPNADLKFDAHKLVLCNNPTLGYWGGKNYRIVELPYYVEKAESNSADITIKPILDLENEKLMKKDFDEVVELYLIKGIVYSYFKDVWGKTYGEHRKDIFEYVLEDYQLPKSICENKRFRSKLQQAYNLGKEKFLADQSYVRQLFMQFTKVAKKDIKLISLFAKKPGISVTMKRLGREIFIKDSVFK